MPLASGQLARSVMNEFLIGAIAGILMGVLGGGGAVITVPLLSYAFGFTAKASIGAALLVVAIASGIGALNQFRYGLVNVKIAAIFGLAGAVGSVGGAWLANMLSDATQLLLFAAVTLLSAISMLRGSGNVTVPHTVALPLMIWLALSIGVLTGLIGVGGGFLLVPVMSLLIGLPTKEAVGTSLAVVAANSAVAAVGYSQYIPRTGTLVLFALGMAIACPLAARLASRIPEKTLRAVFGILLLLVSGLIVLKEFTS
jgi:uncharacterized protein